ncbi:MAG: DegT/DnrJ/EryC1/StrS family aminotransferase, partial [Pyrobaculum sp.]
MFRQKPGKADECGGRDSNPGLPGYEPYAGYNYRMTEVQGVLAYYQLRQLPEMQRRHEAYVKVLLEELAPLEGDI